MSPRTPLRRALAAAAATVPVLLVVLGTAGSATAADGAIVNVERTGSGLVVSVDVPADADVDLDGVSASVNGTSYDATAARIADGTSRVQRTTVLAIDTSNSMAGPRFEAAKLAATTFLDNVPADVAVGIVSFASEVRTDLEPTTDRDAARAVVAGLELSRQTLLYDGVLRAVELTGTEGQRAVLVLSDGADTGTTPLTDVTAAVEGSDGVVVDVVALEQSGGALDALTTIAGQAGEVIASDSEALAATFSAEADVLARQVAVTVDVPADVVARQIDVAVTLPAPLGDVVARSTVPRVAGQASGGLEAIPETAAPSAAAGTPEWFMYVGVAVLGAGLLAALVLLVPRKPVAMSAEERVSTYTASTFGGTAPVKDVPETAIRDQASDAIAGMLDRNKSLDDRISQRLEAAGSELKPSEWLLVHAGLFLAISVVGLLLGRGNVVAGLIFMVLGVVGPWAYLGFRGTRRRKAFNAALPETLQLMSGSLSAGLSLMQSVDTIVREGTDPIASAFRRVLVETRIGVPLEDALDGVADRFDSRDFRWVVMAIKIQRQVGGNLAELLNTVASTMREREYMRRQVAALAAEGKLSAYVLGGLPPAFLLYLLVGQGDYVQVLFTDPRGIIMLVGAGLWLSVGVFWMSKLVKVEV
ncbi:type II secretion system F family protein [Nocardioides sp.]|uniref:type II secretion system F family protein n=1 Tax=Nocardioides sp. TaxID=35761 RepID=UPI002719C7E0|nr:type II secretion system F family protein [Nocardioides sp.]MDO9458444.1 type II secretion system F family protein [Nocardioides sp.]